MSIKVISSITNYPQATGNSQKLRNDVLGIPINHVQPNTQGLLLKCKDISSPFFPSNVYGPTCIVRVISTLTIAYQLVALGKDRHPYGDHYLWWSGKSWMLSDRDMDIHSAKDLGLASRYTCVLDITMLLILHTAELSAL